LRWQVTQLQKLRLITMMAVCRFPCGTYARIPVILTSFHAREGRAMVIFRDVKRETQQSFRKPYHAFQKAFEGKVKETLSGQINGLRK